MHLTLDNEPLETTPEHPFFTQERGWVNAGDLQHGEHVRKADGGYGVVQADVIVQRSQIMYNLTVAVAHTFFVGAGQWLVHNTCMPEISKISDDWGTKGAHIHVGKVELKVLPGNNGTIVFKPVFSATSEADAAAAIRAANKALVNPLWRHQLYEAAARGTEFLRTSGNPKWIAKSGETSFLMKALAKMGF